MNRPAVLRRRDAEVQEEAERFGSALDLALAGRAGGEPPDGGHEAEQADLEMARLLGQTRFAPSRRFELRLRNQLMNRLYEKEAKGMSVSRVFRSVVRPLAVATVSAVLLFGMVMVFSPQARASAGDWAARFVETDSPLALLPARMLSGIVPQAGITPSSQPSGPEGLKLPGAAPSLPGGQVGPSGIPAQSTAQQSLISLQEAQARVSFKIRVPSQLPSGYKLLGVSVPPSATLDAGIAPLPQDSAAVPAAPDASRQLPANPPSLEAPQNVILVFGNGSNEVLMLAEARMPALGDIEVPLPAGKGSLQDATVKGQPAQYVEGGWTDSGWSSAGGRQLHWQDAEGVTYDLLSAKLGLKELLAVAESLQ